MQALKYVGGLHFRKTTMKPTLVLSIFALLFFSTIHGSHSYEFKRADFCPVNQDSSQLKIISNDSISLSTNPWISTLNFIKYCVHWRRSPEKPTLTNQKTINDNIHFNFNLSQDHLDYDVYFNPYEHTHEFTKFNDRKQKYEHKFEEPAHKNDVIRALESSDNQLKHCYDTYKDESAFNSIHSKRKDALNTFFEGKDCYISKVYPISMSVEKLLMDNDCNPHLTSFLGGFELQHALHKEFIDIFTKTADLTDHPNTHINDTQGISQTLTRFAYAGQQHNRLGYVKDAYFFADFCYGALECLEQAYAFECELEYAIGRGFRQGSKNFFTKAGDPINTLHNSIESIRQLGTFVLNVSDSLRNMALEAIHKKATQAFKDGKNILLNKTTVFDVFAREMAHLNDTKDLTVLYLKKGLEVVGDNITQANILYGAEHGTEIATEMALSHATLNALGTLVGNGTKALETFIDAGQGSLPYMDLPISGATLEAAIAQASVAARIEERALELAHAAGVTLSDVIDKAAIIAPPVIAGSGDPNGSQKDLLDIVHQTYYPMAEDIPKIHATFHETRQGFNDVTKNKSLKIDLEHILEGEVVIEFKKGREIKKLKGCHHDFMGYLEKNKKILLEDHIYDSYGCYKARPFGHDEFKSFFPQHWTRQEVIQNVHEAYDYCLKNNIQAHFNKDGKFELIGIAKNGLEIQMFIDQNCRIKTAFPLIKN